MRMRLNGLLIVSLYPQISSLLLAAAMRFTVSLSTSSGLSVEMRKKGERPWANPVTDPTYASSSMYFVTATSPANVLPAGLLAPISAAQPI